MSEVKTIGFEIRGDIGILRFQREKDTNPFSRAMTLELMQFAKDLRTLIEEGKSPIKSLILFGGEDRCFSVGGDFNDVSALKTREEISTYLSEIIDLYISILELNIPVVAAIDRYAIGQGLQVALMSDWRLGSERSLLQMPELKNGTACPLGSSILESLLGRALMLELILDSEFISAGESRTMRLLNQVVPSGEDLLKSAIETARRLATFPSIPFSSTKKIQNARLIKILEDGRQSSIEAHVSTVSTRSGQKHYDRILGRLENE